MKINDLKLNNFIVDKDQTIKEAMAAINDNHRGAVVVVDKSYLMVGIVSDGDIRRSIVGGRDIMSTVEEIVNANPIFIKDGQSVFGEAEKIFKDRVEINIIPIVDKNNNLTNIIIRNPLM